MPGRSFPWKEASLGRKNVLVFTKEYGLGLDGVNYRESLTTRIWNRSGGSSLEIQCTEKTEEHPNIASGTDNAYQEP